MRKVLFIFSVLTDGDVEWLAQAGQRMHLDGGTTLIPHGARVDTIYFVLDGRLGVRTRSGETIAHMESGEVIGEMSLVDPAPTTVFVDVLADSTVLRISHAAMREKLDADPAFASRFYRALCVFLADRMRHATRRMGYGSAAPSHDDHAEEELNEDLLDNVHLAGARFERMLRRLAA